MKSLNLGVLAHVDAGKTTLTERLLFDAGVIREFGSVDAGTTQTDSLELERRRGITIRTAVASFLVDGVVVNLIDTPGHPDFIAEVERALGVLDGAVLVVSASEGVQPQTRVLWRALQRQGVPTVVFINKLDRVGADFDRALAEVRRRLDVPAVAMVDVVAQTTREAHADERPLDDAAFLDDLARVLADRSDDVLGRYVEGETISDEVLLAEFRHQVARCDVLPVYAGVALTGAGCDLLLHGLASLLPTASGSAERATSGRVFKVERSRSGGRVALLRLFDGLLRVRDTVLVGATMHRVTALEVFAEGGVHRREVIRAGEIGRVAGLSGARVGDWVGVAREGTTVRFPPPPLEAVVEPVVPSDGSALRRALEQLADQDPLINVRVEDDGSLAVSLYGEVQREVIAETLEADFDVAVRFHETTPVCVERPTRTAAAVELLQDPANPISATVGLRIEPLPAGSGVHFELDLDSRLDPIHIYKTHEAFRATMARHVTAALALGLRGWRVTDCLVALTDCDYYVGDGNVPPGTTKTNAADFRRLTPIVVRAALERAGTTVCEPVAAARLEVPAEDLRATMSLLARLRGRPGGPTVDGHLARLDATVPMTSAASLQSELVGLTHGDGICELEFMGYEALPEDA